MLERALGRRPADAESWLLLAFTYQELGHPDTAVAFASHALALDPERPGLREAAGRIAGAP
jgi:cytochrome c-type biogenesis protein CcmH/NrfG